MRLSRSLSVLSVLGLALVLTQCGGGGGGETPATNTPVANATPVPSPSPVATPPAVLTASCPYGPGTPNPTCRIGVGDRRFVATAEAAIEAVIRRDPTIFNFNDERGAGGYKLRSEGRFYVYFLEEIRKLGVCAEYDGEEVPVKNSQDYHEQLKLTVSTGHLRRGNALFQASCEPSGFPLPKAPLPANSGPGCSLPASREIACHHEEESRYLDDVNAAVVHLINTQPQIFTNVGPNPNPDIWYQIANEQAYLDGIKNYLAARGYCMHFDGEEIQVKKDNTFSELFDVMTFDYKARHGAGSYTVTCYPPTF